MKKVLSVVLLFVVLSGVYGQGIRMGLSGSPQLTWMKSDDGNTKSDGVQFGFKFGMTTDLFFAERYSFSTGVFINNTGGSLKYADSLRFSTNNKDYNFHPGAVVKYKIQYIDIPAIFRMESNQIGYWVYYAEFGVTNHLKVGASADIDANADSDDGQSIENITLSGVGCKDEVNFYNLDYNIGMGASYYFSKNTALTFGLLYSNGFIDITSDDNKQTKDNVSLRGLTLKVGILF